MSNNETPKSGKVLVVGGGGTAMSPMIINELIKSRDQIPPVIMGNKYKNPPHHNWKNGRS